MMLKVLCVLDKAVNGYLQPFFVRSTGEGIRSFSDACADEKSQFNRHCDDYVLMALGEYDDSTGLFSCSEPVRIVSAREVLPDPFTEETRLESRLAS